MAQLPSEPLSDPDRIVNPAGYVVTGGLTYNDGTSPANLGAPADGSFVWMRQSDANQDWGIDVTFPTFIPGAPIAEAQVIVSGSVGTVYQSGGLVAFLGGAGGSVTIVGDSSRRYALQFTSDADITTGLHVLIGRGFGTTPVVVDAVQLYVWLAVKPPLRQLQRASGTLSTPPLRQIQTVQAVPLRQLQNGAR